MLAAPITVPAALPTAASADGDPASDYLLYQVFTPSPRGHRRSPATDRHSGRGQASGVRDPRRRHRVGCRPWRRAQPLGKPQTYARFLGAELQFAYKGRLLVVMSDGAGYTKNGSPAPGSTKLLATLRPAGCATDRLTEAAITAIRRIAEAAGHQLPANPALLATDATPGAARSDGCSCSPSRSNSSSAASCWPLRSGSSSAAADVEVIHGDHESLIPRPARKASLDVRQPRSTSAGLP
jgi:hypothetical protein